MELEAILAAAAEAGATTAGYVLLRLPLEIKDLFTEWLEAHEPAKARHVLEPDPRDPPRRPLCR